MDDFSRSSEVICDTFELKKLITQWTQNEEWEFEDFATFAELIGIKAAKQSINLWGLNEKEKSFKCTTTRNTEATVNLHLYDVVNPCSEIWVTEGDETKKYVTNCKNTQEDVPEVILYGKTIIKNDNKLNCTYDRFLLDRTLIIGSTHKLWIIIDAPKEKSENNSNNTLRNCKQIEEYLLGLDNSLVIEEVFDKVTKFLGLSNETISDCKSIIFLYTKLVDEKEEIISEIYQEKGKETVKK